MIWVVSLSAMRLIPHCLTPGEHITAFGVWLGLVVLRTPSPSSALPPSLNCKAIPKYISGRTSYFQVCLAFHPYPQLIRVVFNLQRFGPSRHFTGASLWPWIDHLVSGLLHATNSPYSDSLSLRLHLTA